MLDTSSIGNFPRTESLMISSHEQCESEHYFRFWSHLTKMGNFLYFFTKKGSTKQFLMYEKLSFL